MVSDRTPVLIGVGQVVERVGAADYVGKSAAELATEAVRVALADCGAPGVLAAVDALGASRTFEDLRAEPYPFGKPDKFPWSIARRLGVQPRVVIYETAGGYSPVTLLTDLADRIAAGDIDVAIACGGEAISSSRHLRSTGQTRDWSETLDGEMEDHGVGGGIMKQDIAKHGAASPPAAYALLENARRARLGLDRKAYAKEMGRLFAPFTKVAAGNPYSAAEVTASTGEELTTVTERNRMIADPYPRKLVARDQVNLAAAVILCSAAKARALGVPEDKWVFVHGAAVARERHILERPDMGAFPAAVGALQGALAQAGKSAAEIGHFDFYSCFPIAVFTAAVDGLGLAADDPRGLTVTGGLPYFGGPGNNYSMHALASMVERVREAPGDFGLVGANGGFLSKYAAVVLSTAPSEWPVRDECLQEELDAKAMPRVSYEPNGWGKILTYTVTYAKGEPATAIIVGELDTGERFIANDADPATLQRMLKADPLGARVHVRQTAQGNRFVFAPASQPRAKPRFEASYEAALVTRRGRVLEVTINRPEVRNAVHTAGNQEFGRIFDAFEADPDLWVAILTGAGDKAFCAGADLKNASSSRSGGMPIAGFCGLTRRKGRLKPVIAAVNGFAFGGGFESALACDMIVADPSAKFALSEVKVGVFAAEGGVVRLPRQIPRKIAMEMMLTGRAMDAEEARGYGLVNKISAPGEVMAEARALADAISAVSPTSVRLVMQVLHDTDRFADADEAARQVIWSGAMEALMSSEDAAEGMRAFVEKRPPNWKNR